MAGPRKTGGTLSRLDSNTTPSKAVVLAVSSTDRNSAKAKFLSFIIFTLMIALPG